MPNYLEMYQKLFKVQVDAIEELKAITDSLIQAHLQAEEMYIDEPNIVLFEVAKNKNKSKDD